MKSKNKYNVSVDRNDSICTHFLFGKIDRTEHWKKEKGGFTMKKMQGLTLLLLVSMFASACGQNQEVENTILIAYFSRYGNTDYPEDVDATTSASIVVDNGTFGTTEYLARMIQEKTGGDLHLIETVTGYTTDFENCEKYTLEEIKSNTYRHKIYGIDKFKIATQEHFVISIDDLKKLGMNKRTIYSY